MNLHSGIYYIKNDSPYKFKVTVSFGDDMKFMTHDETEITLDIPAGQDDIILWTCEEERTSLS